MNSNVLKDFWHYEMKIPIPIINLTHHNYEEYTEKICPICYHSISLKVRPDSCFHYFCRNCLNRWSKINKICHCAGKSTKHSK